MSPNPLDVHTLIKQYQQVPAAASPPHRCGAPWISSAAPIERQTGEEPLCARQHRNHQLARLQSETTTGELVHIGVLAGTSCRKFQVVVPVPVARPEGSGWSRPSAVARPANPLGEDAPVVLSRRFAGVHGRLREKRKRPAQWYSVAGSLGDQVQQLDQTEGLRWTNPPAKIAAIGSEVGHVTFGRREGQLQCLRVDDFVHGVHAGRCCYGTAPQLAAQLVVETRSWSSVRPLAT
jgi:hypothetical protein